MPGFQTSAGSPASEKPRPASGRANRRRPRPCSCTWRCLHPRVLRRKRARARHTDHTREASSPGARRRGPRALVRARSALERFEPARGPPLHMEASPLGSHLPGMKRRYLESKVCDLAVRPPTRRVPSHATLLLLAATSCTPPRCAQPTNSHLTENARATRPKTGCPG